MRNQPTPVENGALLLAHTIHDLRRLAVRLAWMAFEDGADCTCCPGDECPVCHALRVLGDDCPPTANRGQR